MGRKKLIETPERMWELFTAYKEWVKANPILIEDYVGKDAERVMRQKPRPLTMEGFECFVMDNTEVTYPDLTRYFENSENSYIDYVPILTRIKREIRGEQISGAMVGVYQHQLTARLNGLADKVENKHEVAGVEQIIVKRKSDN